MTAAAQERTLPMASNPPTSENYRVCFRPENRAVTVAAGASILDAALQAGVFTGGLCGGDGVCGRCLVVLREGEVLESIGGGRPAADEFRAGCVLACQAHIASDVVVEIPVGTTLHETPTAVASRVLDLSEARGSARQPANLAPLVAKTYLQLPPADLDNNVADLQRLEQGLGKHMQGREFQTGLDVARRLPAMLRAARWQLTAVLGFGGALTEILDIEPGNTSERNLCIAADIGTTTVVCELVDCRDGQALGHASTYNSQAAYGADVIRRIIHASEHPDAQTMLQRAIIGDVNELIRELLHQYHLKPADVTFVTAGGNTAMLHLLLGLPAEHIRRQPFVGAAYRLPPLRAAEIGLQINPHGRLYCLPSVASFVGGDIVAGIYACGLAEREELRMLIDIGTNGEVVIGNRDFLVSASASAGPAFEGAECRCGMRATRGAIDHIRLADATHVLGYSTIGAMSPIGLAGTAYVDVIAEMLRVGVIDKTGRIDRYVAGSRAREGEHGEVEYELISAEQSGYDNRIVITQGDINNVLRAKGAMYAAIEVLLRALGLSVNDLSEIMVAGSFGNSLNLANAVAIGLLPDLPPQRLRFVGNSCLAGARLAALSRQAYADMTRIADRTTYFELSTDPLFMDRFVAACFLPHTDIELFPSVAAAMGGY